MSLVSFHCSSCHAMEQATVVNKKKKFSGLIKFTKMKIIPFCVFFFRCVKISRTPSIFFG